MWIQGSHWEDKAKVKRKGRNMRELYLGIDVGTTGLRANFYYAD